MRLLLGDKSHTNDELPGRPANKMFSKALTYEHCSISDSGVVRDSHLTPLEWRWRRIACNHFAIHQIEFNEIYLEPWTLVHHRFGGHNIASLRLDFDTICRQLLVLGLSTRGQCGGASGHIVRFIRRLSFYPLRALSTQVER